MLRRTAGQRHGQNAGKRGLADPPMSAEDIAMGNPLLRDGIPQRSGHMLLPDHLGKTLRPVFARQNLIAHWKLDYTLAGTAGFSTAVQEKAKDSPRRHGENRRIEI